MSKILLCNNIIIDSIKDYSVEQLRVFYNIIYLYKEETVFRNNDIEELIIHKDIIKSIFKKSKTSFNTVIDIIDLMPNKIKFIDKDGKIIGFMGVFEYFEYDFEEEQFYIKFTATIIPYLDAISNFSRINLSDIQELSKKYSLRMYELCCKYQNQHFYLMKVDVLKLYFQIPASYEFGEIDRTVLNSSIKEIEKKTNKLIKYEKVKKGKNITHIRFSFFEK